MTHDLQRRIDGMFRLDCIWAWAFVVVLWCVVGFVFFSITSIVDDSTIRTVLMVAAALLLLFNTASIGAMVRHYKQDKQNIYERDIRHLDAYRAGTEAPLSKQPAE